MNVVELILPLPTSANDLWQPNGRGGIRRTDAYNAWRKEAGWEIRRQLAKAPCRKIEGPYKIILHAIRPDQRRRDLGNILKAAEDALTENHVIQDDSYSEMIVMRWVTEGEGIHVRVEPAVTE